jgi:hypothetical protein
MYYRPRTRSRIPQGRVGGIQVRTLPGRPPGRKSTTAQIGSELRLSIGSSPVVKKETARRHRGLSPPRIGTHRRPRAIPVVGRANPSFRNLGVTAGIQATRLPCGNALALRWGSHDSAEGSRHVWPVPSPAGGNGSPIWLKETRLKNELGKHFLTRPVAKPTRTRKLVVIAAARESSPARS